MGSVTVGLGWDVDQGEVDLDVSAAPCHGKHEGNDHKLRLVVSPIIYKVWYKVWWLFGISEPPIVCWMMLDTVWFWWYLTACHVIHRHSRNRASEFFQAKVIRRSASEIWGFPKMVVPNNHRFSYLTSSFWGAWGYHHLRKHPYIHVKSKYPTKRTCE